MDVTLAQILQELFNVTRIKEAQQAEIERLTARVAELEQEGAGETEAEGA